MLKKKNNLIVVLGMHRSGTSVVTRGLQVLGVSLGDRLLPPQGDNTKGFWEDIDIYELNIEILSFIGSDWHHLAPIEPSDVEILCDRGYLERAVKLLHQKMDGVPVFGIKDPRMSKLMPFWKEVFNHCQININYIMAIRHPLSVSKSLASRNGIDIEKSYMLWLGYVMASLVDVPDEKRILVDYDRLIQAPDHEMNRLAEFLDLDIEPAELKSYKTEFLDLGLRHTVYDLNDLLLDGNCPPLTYEVYAALLDVASDKETFYAAERQTIIAQWINEFERDKWAMLLADRLFTRNEELVRNVENFKQDISKYEGQISNLNQTVIECERQSSNLNQTVAEYEGQINNLNQTVAEYEGQINNLNQTVAEYEGQINNLNQTVLERDGLISQIYSSKSWRLSRPFSVVKNIILKQATIVRYLQKSFDAPWYLKQNPDVETDGMDPYEHYQSFGRSEGRLPAPQGFIVRNIKKLHIVFDSLPDFIKSNGGVLRAGFKVLKVLKLDGWRGLVKKVSILQARADMPNDQRSYEANIYKKYIETMEPTEDALRDMAKSVESLDYRPKFSIVAPVYNVEAKWLGLFINSVQAQIYRNWELCIADDHSTLPHVRPLLEGFAAKDKRIRLVFRDTNGHISAATNSALELATGDFICLMDNDDEIAPHALYEFATLLNRDKSIDMIYSDEDKIDIEGNRYEPFFKPDWSPETIEGCMYTAHFACYRMSLVRDIGGFRDAFNGAQDYDFVLRFTERAKKIAHVPKVLYHWRAIPGSTAASMDAKDYVLDAAIRALTERAKRVAGGGEARLGSYSGSFDLRYKINGSPLVSIIIPSAGRMANIGGKDVDLLSQVISSIDNNTTYRNFEIIVVDNNDLRSETREAIKSYDCHFVHFNGEFNIATKMNLGAREARGEYLLFMNDDIEIITPDWMENMLQLCQRKGIGVVGAKLHFENESIQHVGVAFWEGLPDHIHREFPSTYPGHFFSAVANRNYLAVTGAVLMTKRELFDSVGGFDEQFPINYNDIDYCLKVFKEGYRIVFAAGARLFHYESISREAVVEAGEIELFQQKWMDTVEYDPYYSNFFDNHPPVFIMRHNWSPLSINDSLKSPVISHC